MCWIGHGRTRLIHARLVLAGSLRVARVLLSGRVFTGGSRSTLALHISLIAIPFSSSSRRPPGTCHGHRQARAARTPYCCLMLAPAGTRLPSGVHAVLAVQAAAVPGAAVSGRRCPRRCCLGPPPRHRGRSKDGLHGHEKVRTLSLRSSHCGEQGERRPCRGLARAGSSSMGEWRGLLSACRASSAGSLILLVKIWRWFGRTAGNLPLPCCHLQNIYILYMKTCT